MEPAAASNLDGKLEETPKSAVQLNPPENENPDETEKSRPVLKIGHFTLEMPDESEIPNIIFSMIPARWLEFTDADMRGSFLDLLYFYLQYCYVLCIIPFRLLRDSDSIYRLSKSKIQNIACICIHVLIVVYMIHKLRWMNPIETIRSKANTEDSTETFFFVMLAIVESGYMVSFIYIFWTSQPTFLWLAEKYPDRSMEDKSEDKVKQLLMVVFRILQRKHVISIFLCLIFTAIGIAETLNEFLEEAVIFGEGGYLELASKRFLNISETTKLYSWFQFILSGVYVISCLFYNLILHCGHLFFFILALILGEVGNHFVAVLAKKNMTTPEALTHYNSSKAFLDQVNKGFGILTLWSVLSSIPYYGNILPEFLHDQNISWDKWLIQAWNLGYIGVFLYLDSTLVEQLKSLSTFVIKKHNEGEVVDAAVQLKCKTIIDELATNAVGLSCWGFFIVSYGSIGTIMQMLVTYGFIASESISALANSTGILNNLSNDFSDGLETFLG